MMGLSETSGRWKRFAEEVITIVIGILLALAANAGYQYLTDRASERAILGALRIEFAADITELQADQEHRTRKISRIDLLRAVRRSSAQSPPPDTMANALLGILDYRYYTPSHPVLDDLLATGRLGLIRSDDLRHALMLFGQERSRIGVVEQREREFVASQLEPYLAVRLDLQALASDSQNEVDAALASVTELLVDHNFGSLLYLSRTRTEGSLDFGDRLLGTVSRIQRILDQEI